MLSHRKTKKCYDRNLLIKTTTTFKRVQEIRLIPSLWFPLHLFLVSQLISSLKY